MIKLCSRDDRHMTVDFFKRDACPTCEWVHPVLRKNPVNVGSFTIIDFSWLEFTQTRTKDKDDPYDRDSCGDWGRINGYAILNDRHQIIQKSWNINELYDFIKKL